MELNGRKVAALIGIFLLLAGWLAVPPLLQRWYGYPAIPVAFVVIVVYFVGFQFWKRVLK